MTVMFKKLSICLFLILFTANLCAQNGRVSGRISHQVSSEYIYLYEFFGPQLIQIDSALVTNEEFVFEYEKGFPRGFYKLGTNTDQSIILILGNEEFQVEADLNNRTIRHLEGSKENELFLSFLNFNQGLQNRNAVLAQRIETLRSQPGNQQELLTIQEQLDSLHQSQAGFYGNIIENHPNLYISKMALSILHDLNSDEASYFEDGIFMDDEMLRSDLIVGKIYRYFQTYVARNLQSWEMACDKILQQTKPHSQQREAVYLALINIYMSGARAYVWDIAKKYGNEFPGSQKYKYLVSILPPPSPAIGDNAPDIILPDQHGNLQKLSDLKGHYVLVDFWASWCGPCRQENPNVVKAYDKYKQFGFKILGVSLDNDKARWLAAISKDQLSWGHISDLKGWQNEGAATYQVRSIPASFLIDPQGKIIAKNLRGSELHATLEELFKEENKN